MNPQKQTGPVMDVQRPRPNSAPQPTPTSSTSLVDSLAVNTPNPGHVIGETPLPTPPPPEENPEKSHKGLIISLITFAVVLVIGLGVGGFLWYKSSQKPTPATNTTTADSERVDVSEIDATTAEIDKQLNTLDDANDIKTSEIEDDALGL